MEEKDSYSWIFRACCQACQKPSGVVGLGLYPLVPRFLNCFSCAGTSKCRKLLDGK
jgi:hypothetical protein